MRRNRAAFDKLELMPRSLVDVSSVAPCTTLVRLKIAAPVILAPIGSRQTLDPESAVASTTAVDEFGDAVRISSWLGSDGRGAGEGAWRERHLRAQP